jgi:NAD(P) transhydrogenase subunit alpha
MASMSSQLYAATIVALIDELKGEEGLHVDLDDQIARGAVVLHNGKMMWPPPMPAPAPEPGVPTESQAHVAAKKAVAKSGHEAEDNGVSPVMLLIAGIVLFGIGWVVPQSFLSHFTVFILACFVGYQVVWSVKPALHTPLMSVTNAISGIILVGGMLQLSGAHFSASSVLGGIAILLATINIAGGFLVTKRMLAMFHK